LILKLQSLPELGGIMKVVSWFGSEAIWPLLAAIYLVINPVVGRRLLLLFLVGEWVAGFSKFFFELPRPYWISAAVQGWSQSSSYGFPSGHALNATVFWVGLGRELGRRSTLAAGVVIALLVCLSRVYLGVHFIADVIGGFGLGIIMVILFTSRSIPLLERFLAKGRYETLLAGIMFSVLLVTAVAIWWNPLATEAAVSTAKAAAGWAGGLLFGTISLALAIQRDAREERLTAPGIGPLISTFAGAGLIAWIYRGCFNEPEVSNAAWKWIAAAFAFYGAAMFWLGLGGRLLFERLSRRLPKRREPHNGAAPR
jgi:membrane-associated phospholipid phosphatase